MPHAKLLSILVADYLYAIKVSQVLACILTYTLK